MKFLTVNGEQYKAEKVVKTSIIVDGDVVGYNITGFIGGHEVFKFGGISDLNMYKLADEGNLTSNAEYDISEEEETQNTIDSLGTQLTQSKLEDLQNKTINNSLGKQLVQTKLNLIKVQGGN